MVLKIEMDLLKKIMPCLQAIDLHLRRHFLFFRYVLFLLLLHISDKPKNHKFPPPKTIYRYVVLQLREKKMLIETCVYLVKYLFITKMSKRQL